MNTQLILDYLTGLSANNNREWYHAHKSEHQTANAQFEELLQALILRIGEFDGSVLGRAPRELTFKMVRDTRFSHDKSPYNPAFRAHISSMGKLPVPVGYYLMIKPGGQSFLGCSPICLKTPLEWYGITSRSMAANGRQSSLPPLFRNILPWRDPY